MCRNVLISSFYQVVAMKDDKHIYMTSSRLTVLSEQQQQHTSNATVSSERGNQKNSDHKPHRACKESVRKCFQFNKWPLIGGLYYDAHRYVGQIY